MLSFGTWIVVGAMYLLLITLLSALSRYVEKRLDKNRRLWKNCERLLNTSLQFVHLAFLALMLRRS
jgi:hypothetical protein